MKSQPISLQWLACCLKLCVTCPRVLQQNKESKGLQNVFFFSKGRSEWTLYLHFNREAVQCNPFWYHCLHCYLCLSFFLRLSACECVHAFIWFLKNKNKKHVTPVFLLTSKFVYTDPSHQMFSQHDQCTTDVHITYGT